MSHHPDESFIAKKDTFQLLAIEEQTNRLLYRNSNKISNVMDGLQPLLSIQSPNTNSTGIHLYKNKINYHFVEKDGQLDDIPVMLTWAGK